MLWNAVNILTDLGDSALLLPIAALVFGYLLVLRSPRLALGWASAIGFCLATMTLLKIGFHACGARVMAGAIASPSGHAAFSAAIYGSLAILFRRMSGDGYRALPVLAAAPLIGGIAVSRVLLGVHSPLEVAIGLTVGLLAVALFAVTTRTAAERPITLKTAFAIALLLGIALHGMRLPMETMLHDIAAAIRSDIDVCV